MFHVGEPTTLSTFMKWGWWRWPFSRDMNQPREILSMSHVHTQQTRTIMLKEDTIHFDNLSWSDDGTTFSSPFLFSLSCCFFRQGSRLFTRIDKTMVQCNPYPVASSSSLNSLALSVFFFGEFPKSPFSGKKGRADRDTQPLENPLERGLKREKTFFTDCRNDTILFRWMLYYVYFFGVWACSGLCLDWKGD